MTGSKAEAAIEAFEQAALAWANAPSDRLVVKVIETGRGLQEILLEQEGRIRALCFVCDDYARKDVVRVAAQVTAAAKKGV